MTRPGLPFFRHRSVGPTPDTVVLSETTRYLCAAAYLDRSYQHALITELVESEHRATVPSVGFDLGPVLRHCWRARHLLLVRDALLTAVLMVALAMTPWVVFWVAIGAGILVGTLLWARQKMLALAAGFATTSVLLYFGGRLSPYFTQLIGFGSSESTYPYSEPHPYADGPQPTDIDEAGLMWSDVALRVGAIAVLTVSAYAWWQWRVHRVLTSDLASGQPHRLPEVPHGRVRQRVAAVAAAQWGNLTLHAHRDPFLGAGEVIHSWSMSLPLRGPDGGPQSIDPVDMYGWIRDQLGAMRGEDLIPRERISGLIVFDHIVATGERKMPDPLVDPVSRVPYAEAGPEAVAAIMRHPQGSLRYYLRTVVGAEGREVRLDDRLVAPAQDQEIAVSTFLYLAVEGGMLYVEFVATVLPPLVRDVHAIDHLAPERAIGSALFAALRRGVPALVAAPLNFARGIVAVVGVGYRMDQAGRACRETPVYDYGARLSVRDRASDRKLSNYLQKLDAEKYYKLVERAITEATLTFLDRRGVDTSEYRTRAMTVLNNGVMITGGVVSGPVAGGTHAAATTSGGQATPAPQPAPAAAS